MPLAYFNKINLLHNNEMSILSPLYTRSNKFNIVFRPPNFNLNKHILCNNIEIDKDKQYNK